MPFGANGEFQGSSSPGGGGGGGGTISDITSTDHSVTITSPHGPTTNLSVPVLPAAPNIGVNNNTPSDTGLVPLAIQRQPIVPANGVLPQQPPLTGFTFPGSFKILAQGVPSPNQYYGICNHQSGSCFAVDEANGGQLVRIDLDGTQTVFVPPATGLTSSGQDICAGPDANLYVASGSDHNVQQVAYPSATVTDYTDMAGAGNIVGICTGADGFIYACDTNAQVWKLDPTMVAASVAIPLDGSPAFCCAGPDGNVWVSSALVPTGSLWRIEPNGTTTRFNITGATVVSGICAGPDNHIYVCGTLTDKNVYKFDLTGTLVATIPTGVVGTLGEIVAGGGGDVWAICPDALVKITPDDQVTLFQLPNDQAAEWLCVGPDGGFWITDAGTSAVYIGSFVTPGVPRLIAIPFDFDTGTLAAGVPIYQGAAGQQITNGWMQINQNWDGTTPRGDFGIPAGTEGFIGICQSGWGGTPLGIDMQSGFNPNGGLGNSPQALTSLRSAGIAGVVRQLLGSQQVPATDPAFLEPFNTNATDLGVVTLTDASQIRVWVTEDGTIGGTDPGSTQGKAIMFLEVVTPV